MSNIFDIVGWKDWNGDNQPMPAPDDPALVAGFRVHIWDEDSPQRQDGFWAYNPPGTAGRGQYESWEDWYDYIIYLATEEYGIEVG